MQFIKTISACLAASFAVVLIVVAWSLWTLGDANTGIGFHLGGAYPFGFIYFPAFCSIALLIYEPHKGWKRLTLILGVAGSVLLVYPFSYLMSSPYQSLHSFSLGIAILLMPIIFSLIVFSLIGGKKAILWIKDGFAKSDGGL